MRLTQLVQYQRKPVTLNRKLDPLLRRQTRAPVMCGFLSAAGRKRAYGPRTTAKESFIVLSAQNGRTALWRHWSQKWTARNSQRRSSNPWGSVLWRKRHSRGQMSAKHGRTFERLYSVTHSRVHDRRMFLFEQFATATTTLTRYHRPSLSLPTRLIRITWKIYTDTSLAKFVRRFDRLF